MAAAGCALALGRRGRRRRGTSAAPGAGRWRPRRGRRRRAGRGGAARARARRAGRRRRPVRDRRAAHASRRSGRAAPAAARGGRGAPPRWRPHRAAAILDELLAEAPPGPERADVLFALARVRRADLPTIVMWCERALAETGEDHRRAAEILVFLSWMRLLEGHVRDALAHARGALGHAELAGDDELHARAIARVAMAETWTLEVTPGLLGGGRDRGGPRAAARVPRERARHARPPADAARRLRRRAAASGRRLGAREGPRRRGVVRAPALPWLPGRVVHRALERRRSPGGGGARARRPAGRRAVPGIALYARSLLDAHLGRVAAARAAATEALAIADALSDSLFGLQSRRPRIHRPLLRGRRGGNRHLCPLPAWLHEHG